MAIKLVGVVSRPERARALRLATQVSEFLESAGVEVLTEPAIAAFRGRKEEGANVADMGVDIMVVVGGNGTILRTCSELGDREIPILAINMGTKGLLSEVRPREAFSALQRCLEGNFVIEKCSKLSVAVNGRKLPDALNEVLLAASPPAKMLRLGIVKDGSRVLAFLADGLLIATPTGSTAHSSSAGGPVLDPGTEAFVLTPICPLTPVRPLVFPSSSVVKVRLLKAKTRASIAIDGLPQLEMTTRDELTVKRSASSALFVRFDQAFFYRRLGSLARVSKGKS